MPGRRLPSLDGWRALSILLVLGHHWILSSGFPQRLTGPLHWLFDGGLGVRLFFGISGFLITWLLLQEWRETRRINLRNFYIRRALRILPVYAAFLATLFLLGRLDGRYNNHHSWLACLTFTRNTFGNAGLTSHLWSLSIEEQFYLIWPTLLLLLLTFGSLGRLIAVTGIIILMAPAVEGLSDMGIAPGYATLAFPASPAAAAVYYPLAILCRFLIFADTLAFGCLAAILLATKPKMVAAKVTRHPGLAAGIALACILGPYVTDHLATGQINTGPNLSDQLGKTIQAVGFSVLLLQSILLPKAGFWRVLNWKPVAQLGVLSYSLYIWQQIVWLAPVDRLKEIWWMGLWLPVLLLMVSVSYYAMELPLMNLRRAFRPKST